MNARRTLFIVGALAVVGGGAVAFVALRVRFSRIVPDNAIPAVTTPVAATVPRWLDGLTMPEGSVQPSALAVVIDNAPEARPQAGLAAAAVVVEAPVEGGRTRFLAVYAADGEVPTIGPVRSSRPYFASIARAFRAPLAHVGGSAAGLEVFRQWSWPHINQYFDPPFRRDRTKRAPFNVYTSLPELTAFAASQRWYESAVGAWSFGWAFDEQPAETGGESVSTIRVAFGVTIARWTYDPVRELYIRSQDGAAHFDAGGAEIAAANVIIVPVRTQVLDAVGRLRIPRVEPVIWEPGKGAMSKVQIHRDGLRWVGVWALGSGASGSEENALRAETGEPLLLRPGRTWIELVPNGTLEVTN